MKSPYFILLLTGVLLIPALNASQVYVWTDEHGKKHYSDTPPPEDIETSQETFNVQNIDDGYPHTDPDSYKHIQESWAEKKKREQREKAELDRKRKAHMTGPCNKAKNRLSLLQGPVAFYDDDGKEIRVSEKQRKQEVAELTADIKKFCD